jgi:hypothetical protein
MKILVSLRAGWASALLAIGLLVNGQGLEGVLVERYHELPANVQGDEAPLVTYRIYLDLAPGYSLLSVFGEQDRHLFYRTSTRFFNDTVNGTGGGERVDPKLLQRFPLALDSWLAFGFATSAHKAVPLHLDPDGSVLRRSRTRDGAPGYDLDLHKKDGLVPANRVPEVMKLDFTTSYLENLEGSLLETTVGAYGVMGSVAGATPENMVLIAQLTTDGELSYGINVALRAPDGTIVKYLAYPAKAADEVEFPALRMGRRF